MLVDGGKGEEEGALEDCVEVGDTVEDANEVDEACDETYDVLGEDGFWDVSTWPGNQLV